MASSAFLFAAAIVLLLATASWVFAQQGSAHGRPAMFDFSCDDKPAGLHPDVARLCQVFYLCTKSHQMYTMNCGQLIAANGGKEYVYDPKEQECVPKAKASECKAVGTGKNGPGVTAPPKKKG